jgi:tight adherence protein B
VHRLRSSLPNASLWRSKSPGNCSSELGSTKVLSGNYSGEALKSLALLLEGAGLGSYQPWHFIVGSLSVAAIVGSWAHLSFQVLGLSVSIAIAVLGLCFEAINLRAKSRSDAIAKLWPEVIESLQSAAKSGMGLIDSISELGESGPWQIRKQFASFVQRIDGGQSFDASLTLLKSELGQLHADRLIELIRLVHLSGGAGYVESLNSQAKITRSDIATWGELESKQGWVTGTAKLALAAPWVVVLFLASRPENVEIYNSNEGLTVLLVGLTISLIAYRLIGVLGNLAKPKRVFVN